VECKDDADWLKCFTAVEIDRIRQMVGSCSRAYENFDFSRTDGKMYDQCFDAVGWAAGRASGL